MHDRKKGFSQTTCHRTRFKMFTGGFLYEGIPEEEFFERGHGEGRYLIITLLIRIDLYATDI